MTFQPVRGATDRRELTRRRAGRGDELARWYAEHSHRLLRLAALLVPDPSAAREVMYEAFAAMHQSRGRLRRPDDVFAFLLRDVVFRARVLMSPEAGQLLRMPDGQEASVLNAVLSLPASQREALVLRYHGQLSDEQAAAAMGVAPAELRSHLSSGMAALRTALSSGITSPDITESQ